MVWKFLLRDKSARSDKVPRRGRPTPRSKEIAMDFKAQSDLKNKREPVQLNWLSFIEELMTDLSARACL